MPSDNPTLALPRILCLHGGGVTAEIFALQARVLTSTLSSHFRFVFADGPYFCDAGPGIAAVYGAYGPFRRWLRWLPDHSEVDDEAAVEEILYAIRGAMREDPGTGPWVGVLGFSQGAKVAASLLYDTQCRMKQTGTDEFGWKFAVLLQGRHPLVSLSEYSKHPAVINAGDVSEGFDYHGTFEEKLSLPTVHVHGLKDEGLPLHRRMLRQYCDPRSVTLVEWDGTHRVPLMKRDVTPICEAIIKVATSQGIWS
ncbi:hypothetical protein K461DRAFT_266452 [Myriangium duriaei CBS 260.36]|uniref:Serine hydrolase domain-containing protein n=1 Tax=Myriangium duriaei CBS 260.36 TaxID=1168546 RepID=A0A9P4J828_9PEZI|nr:hypothetical protein K461DRAFT_266452 [Myriangium duriaei CBS 260.36]